MEDQRAEEIWRENEIRSGRNPGQGYCYFYFEERQMGGIIPTCSYYNKGLGYCPCEGCKKYISKSDVSNIVKETVDKE